MKKIFGSLLLTAIVMTLICSLSLSAFAAEDYRVAFAASSFDDSIASYDGTKPMIMSGNAKINGDMIELVPNDVGFKKGGVFITEKVQQGEGDNAGFSTAFTMHLGGTQGKYIADGFTFVVAKNNNTVGLTGQGMGYKGINNSVGLEVDTFNNGKVRTGDPHMALNYNGILSDSDDTDFTPQTLLSSYMKKNEVNLDLSMWIDYSAKDKYMTVYMAKNSTVRPAVAVAGYSVDLSEYCGDEYYIGFTAANGSCIQQYALSTALLIDNEYHKDSLDLSNADQYISETVAEPTATPEATEEPQATAEPTAIPEATEEPGEVILAENQAKVVKYDVELNEYSLGVMNIVNHTPAGYDDLRYKVLDEGSYKVTGAQDIANYDVIKKKVQKILNATNDVFVEREDEIDYNYFGRVDSNGFDTSLTITPYVVPQIENDIDTMWLAFGDRAGKVTTVWMVIE